jgi:hypothetical protein
MIGTAYVFLALTNPVGQREAEFNEWYSRRHIPEVVTHGRGFSGGRRFRQHGVLRPEGVLAWRYLALYDMTSDDLRAYHRQPWNDLHPPLTPFTGLLQDDHAAWIFSPVGARVFADGRSPGEPSDVATAAEAACLVMEMGDAPADDLTAKDSWLSHTPGAIAGRLYRLAEHQRPLQPAAPSQYLALYEFDQQDGDIVLTSVHAARQGVSQNASRERAQSTLTAWVPLGDYVGTRAAAAVIAARG